MSASGKALERLQQRVVEKPTPKKPLTQIKISKPIYYGARPTKFPLAPTTFEIIAPSAQPSPAPVLIPQTPNIHLYVPNIGMLNWGPPVNANWNILDVLLSSTVVIGYPPSGIPVSTGAAWGSSLDPASLISYPPAGIAVSTGYSWGPSINPDLTFQYPPAGIVTSTGSSWGQPFDPTTAAPYPTAGIPVSQGTSWGTSINPATVIITNPTVATTLDYDWNDWTLQGSAPAGTAASGGNAPNYLLMNGPNGQATTGTTGQVGGNGGPAVLGAGNGGPAPAGSTNGNGGNIFISGGRSGQGAGAAGVGGNVLINNNWGDTYIGGNAGHGVHVAFGGNVDTPGTITTTANNSPVTSPANGLMLAWNVQSGVGETDFINSRAGGGGGFHWYNVPSSSVISSSTQATMVLDSSNNLSIFGGRFFSQGAGQSAGLWIQSTDYSNCYFVLETFSQNLRWRTLRSDGSLDHVFFELDRDPNDAANGNGQQIQMNVPKVYVANGKLAFLDRTLGINANQYGPNINSDNSSLILNCAAGGSMYLNWDIASGSGSNYYFGSGVIAGGTIAQIDYQGTGFFGMTSSGTTGVRIGNRSLISPWQGGQPNINADMNLVLNATPSGAIYFNYDMSSNGVKFCNGASVVVGSVDGSGNASFNGTMHSSNATITNNLQANNISLPNLNAANMTDLLIYCGLPGGGNFMSFQQNGDAIITWANPTSSIGGLCIGGWSTATGIRIDTINNYVSIVASQLWAPNTVNTGNNGVIVGGGPHFWWDGGSSFIDGAPNGRLLLNQGPGPGSIVQITGNLSASQNANFGSLQIQGQAPSGYVLMGNGSTYVPQAITSGAISANPSGQLNSVRSMNVVYQNNSGSVMLVSGYAITRGSNVGSVQCLIGTGNPPNLTVFGITTAATVDNGACGFYFCVPAGWFYEVLANTLTNTQGNACYATGCWVETVLNSSGVTTTTFEGGSSGEAGAN